MATVMLPRVLNNITIPSCITKHFAHRRRYFKKSFQVITLLEYSFSEGIPVFQRSKSSKFCACGGLRVSFGASRGMPSRLTNSICLLKFSALRAECLPAKGTQSVYWVSEFFLRRRRGTLKSVSVAHALTKKLYSSAEIFIIALVPKHFFHWVLV